MSKAVLYQFLLAGAGTGLSVAASLTLPAKAALTWNIYQSASNVIVSASGSVQLPQSISTATCGATGAIISSVSAICTGPNNAVNVYRISGAVSMNGTVSQIGANSVTGIAAGMNAGGPTGTGNPGYLFLSPSYSPGTSISSTATFNNKTLAGLGFTTTGLIGTWTLMPANVNDSYSAFDTIYVCLGPGPCGATPTPGPLPVLGAAAAFGVSRRLRRRVALGSVSHPKN